MAELGGGVNIGAWTKSIPPIQSSASPAQPLGLFGTGATMGANKPVPMKLFSTWEVDKSTPSCIPRLCSVTLTRLVVQKQLETELQSLIIAIKMQSSKRVLRSIEIMLPPSGVLDTELDLSFSLQYPHFLKRDGNRLEIMLQRRKKYKNRTILGYKTLAAGHINMSQVLQLPMDLDMSLYATDSKDLSKPVAHVTMLSLSSQPVDHDDRRPLPATDLADRSPCDLSDDDEREYPEYSSGGKYGSSKYGSKYASSKYRASKYSSKGLGGEDTYDSSPDENSDPDPMTGDDERPPPTHRSSASRKLHHDDGNPTFASRQRNLKQKFVSLLRRFKVTEDVLESVQELGGDRDSNSRFVEDLLEDVENLSDSDPDIDTISVHSTPKPKLRPFFTGRQHVSALGTFTENLRQPSQYMENERLSDEGTPRRIESDSNPEEEGDSSNIGVLKTKDGAISPAPDSVLALAPPVASTSLSSSPAHDSRSQHRKMSLPVSVRRMHFSSDGKDKEKRGGGSPRGASRERKHSNSTSAAVTVAISTTTASVVSATVGGAAVPPRQGSSSSAEIVPSPLQPRRVLMEQMAAILSSDTALPECIVLVNSHEWQGQLLAQSLQNAKQRTVCTSSQVEVRAVVSAVVTKIQKYKNTPAQSLPMKLAIVGGDSYISSVLRPYVELFSSKSPDWINYIRFLVVPFGSSVIAKNLSLIDAKYNSLFNDSLWKDTVIEKLENSSRFDMSEITSRVVRYLSGANSLVQLPLAEAILTNKNKGADDTSQMIIPFVGEVRVGPIDIGNSAGVPSSTDFDESTSSGQQISLSGSPPQSTHMMMSDKIGLGGSGASSGHVISSTDKVKDIVSTSSNSMGNTAQPSSVSSHGMTSANTSLDSQSSAAAGGGAAGGEAAGVDLQVDYWMTPPSRSDATGSDKGGVGGGGGGATSSGFSSSMGGGAAKKELKCSLKTMFRSMQVYRPLAVGGAGTGLGQQVGGAGGQQQHMGGGAEGSSSVSGSNVTGLTMVVVTREKKQKIMRIGKKSKEAEPMKTQQIDCVSRLICTSKSQNHPLSVQIDGLDCSGVKFFQLSAQWQTHVKYFPVLVFTGGSTSSGNDTPQM